MKTYIVKFSNSREDFKIEAETFDPLVMNGYVFYNFERIERGGMARLEKVSVGMVTADIDNDIVEIVTEK